MSADTYCIHDLLTGSCTICLPPAPNPIGFTQPVERGPWFIASFDSDCDECGDLIEQDSRSRSDGAGGWICESCGEL